METIIDIDGNDECPICMDHGDAPIENMKCCDKKICNDCFNKLPNPECPYCRRPLTPAPSGPVVAPAPPCIWHPQVTCHCCLPLGCCFGFITMLLIASGWLLY